MIYIAKRYNVQARRKKESKWTEWTLVDDFNDAIRHCKRVEELGYDARIVDEKSRLREICRV